MSVLIKGMGMPEGCSECRMQTDEGFCSAMPKEFCGYTDEDRPDWCPLVEVPEKHGRLIEAPDISEYEVFDEDTGTREISLLGLMECHRMVEDAPTVIEAEDE